ncbi:MAG: energy-coupling factor transporter transmembrane protein EcfT [Candidatus Promineofilum sp.]|nr:energy-coupling factor transporter transmembrane protein EcfT [Promineifilum sp.]
MSGRYGLYVIRQTAIHRLHPLTKLAYVLTCLLLGWLIPGVWSPYFVFLIGIVPLALFARVLPTLIRSTILTTLPFAISLFIVQGLFWTGGTVLQQIGPLSLKEEGILFAIRATGRIIIAVSGFLLLNYTTRSDELMLSLSQKGLPNSISYVILSTLQVIPRFQQKANTILDAQRSRGLETEGSLMMRIRALLPLIQPLLLGSIVDIEERAIALEVRAFGRAGPKTSLLTLHDTPAQRVVRWLLLLVSLGAIIWRFYIWLAPRFAA